MSERPDIPDLPRGHYWHAHRVPTAWNKRGAPVLDLRRRRWFGISTVIVARQAIGEIDYTKDPHRVALVYENAMTKIAKKAGL